VFTIIGTISHELGHYCVAKFYGYDAEIDYGHTYFEDKSTSSFTQHIDTTYYKEFEAGTDFPGKTEYLKILEQQKVPSFWIIFGGPAQTILTGTIGLILLYFYRRKNPSEKNINFVQWLLIFLSLFWLRQLANLFTMLLQYLKFGKSSYGHDEVKLALQLKLPKESLTIATGVIAATILVIIIFKIIPTEKRFTFICAGLFGGILGFLFWLV
jgi:hypothetical protein